MRTQDDIGHVGETVTCELCGVSYATSRSLSLHQRQKHPDYYQERNVPRVVRQGWSHDECELVAREELRLVEAGLAKGKTTRIRVNVDLCRAFPHRSMDSIKGLRKQASYQTLRSKLDMSRKEAPPAEPPESPVGSFSVGEGRKWTTPTPKDRKGPKIRWSNELLDEVARREARLSLVGCAAMDVQLSKLFPDRTLEAIKGMRRLQKYMARVKFFLREENAQHTPPEMDLPPPVQGCESRTMVQGMMCQKTRC